MNIEVRKDTIMVSMNQVEMTDVIAPNGMILKIIALSEEFGSAAQAEGKTSLGIRREPIAIYSMYNGSVHILRIICSQWQLFKDVQATSHWEQEIKSAVIALGVSGEADKLTAQYAA